MDCKHSDELYHNQNFMQETVDLVTFTEETLNRKLHFCDSVKYHKAYNCNANGEQGRPSLCLFIPNEMRTIQLPSLHKKSSFLLRIFSVNVKSNAGNCVKRSSCA